MSESAQILNTVRAVVDAMSSCRIEVKERVTALGGRFIVISRKHFAFPDPYGTPFTVIADGEMQWRTEYQSHAYEISKDLELPDGLIGVHNVGPFNFDALPVAFSIPPAYEPKTPQD